MKIPTNNPVFIENSTDPTNGKTVKEIRVYKEYFKNREKTKIDHKWDLKWQYFRDRNRKSVRQFYREHRGHKLKVIYTGDPVQHIIECPLVPKIDKFEEQYKKDMEALAKQAELEKEMESQKVDLQIANE